MTKTNRTKKSQHRRTKKRTARQAGIKKLSGDSHAVSKTPLAIDSSLREVCAKINEGLCLGVQSCQETGNLNLDFYCIDKLPETGIFEFCEQNALVLVEHFQIEHGFEDIAISEIDPVPFVERIVNTREVVSKQIWAFLVKYSLHSVAMMKESRFKSAISILVNSEYDLPTS